MNIFLITLLILTIVYLTWVFIAISIWFLAYGIVYQLAMMIGSILILFLVALSVFNFWRRSKLRFKMGAISATLHFLFVSSVFYYDFKTVPGALGEATGMMTAFVEPHIAAIPNIIRNQVLFVVLIYLLGSIWFFYLPVLMGMISDKRKRIKER